MRALSKRALQTLVTLLLLTLLVFGLARLTGDPTPLILPAEATEQDRDFFRAQYGLDQPLPVQYLIFLRNISEGNFGVSFRYRDPAFGLALAAVGPTLKLTAVSMLLAIAIGLPLGIASAVIRPGWFTRAVSIYSSLGQGVPSFWLGLMLILLFAITLPLLPSSGYGTPSHYVLPALTLGFFASASVVRLARANMDEALRSDFIHLERVLGIPERLVVLKHALRNASLPIVTYIGLEFGILFGGSVVTERVFAWPGVGQTLVEAILTRDYPVVQAMVFISAVIFLLINILVDILHVVLDPRVRRA
jgi:ABC-type dipeptide/oligopeptide/nickel transport system permease component